ncbi:hypothetical protein FoTM2_013268 [Fusarium oxysporum f. sp. vasinfectum]|uniref:Clr5 domain-containing protein n=1 Tax=Fusarium oxysporum f. sp. vasinfectum 25433 TaxID=1089449 RepID=X0KXJ0_FUSOX|nr:hypothetical protein FOTG_18035 [Fusarium oxysporum f. sp. vasinfectum 25433]KAK2926402.1 hypothetical protein FoTM2_013268 [Fusarium oxysporum f. sp. vasinfectum]
MDLGERNGRRAFQPDWHIEEISNADVHKSWYDTQHRSAQGPFYLRWPNTDSQARFAPSSDNICPALRDRLDELYFGHGMQQRVVQEIVWRLYQFKQPDHWFKEGKQSFRKRGIRKNKSGQKTKRWRPGGVLKPKEAAVPFHVVLAQDFVLNPSLDRPIALQRYRKQERILHSLDCYIYSVFDTKSQHGKWTADLLGFVHSSRNPKNWQCLSDQCYGASTLINCKQPQKASVTLEIFFTGIREAALWQDPSMMVKLRRICLELRGIDSRSTQLNTLQRLFNVLEKAFSESFGTGNSLSILVRTLGQVVADDFKPTLRIAFDKTIRTLSSLVGDENAMILHMWSHYFKYWDGQYLAKDTFLLKFDLIWHRTHSSHHSLSEQAITIDYYYAYAAYYLGDVELYSDGMLRQLFHSSTMFLKKQLPLEWKLPTLAFAFSARVVAKIDRKKGRKDLSISTMRYAVETLERGDRECRTRAVMLCQILARWLRQWRMLEDAELESARFTRILGEIN